MKVEAQVLQGSPFMGDNWHIRLWKPHESVDEVKWSMIMLKRFPCVCCFINKLFSITLSHLMLKTTLWSREVSRYTKEESDYLEVKVLSQSQETQVLSLDIYWVTPTASYPGTAEQGIWEGSQVLTVFPWMSLSSVGSVSWEELCLASDKGHGLHGKERKGHPWGAQVE